MARLTRTDWLDHGLETLGSEGFTALKADRMVKTLGVSRGSFYHHFEDLGAFHEAVLNHYLEVSVLAVVAGLEEGDLSAEEKLRALIGMATSGDRNTEQAVRAWAFAEPMVSEVMAELDRQRLAYLTTLIEDAGVDSGAARRRAMLLYLSSVGYYAISDIIDDDLQHEIIDDVVSLAIE